MFRAYPSASKSLKPFHYLDTVFQAVKRQGVSVSKVLYLKCRPDGVSCWVVSNIKLIVHTLASIVILAFTKQSNMRRERTHQRKTLIGIASSHSIRLEKSRGIREERITVRRVTPSQVADRVVARI